jgi:uncharacterized membrane-anchored protein
MQPRNVPATGPRYWTAISIASVFGANLGDFVSHALHMGHIRGVLPLALVFAAILLTERRARSHSEIYYWLAIITLRTAATNLADFATHDLRLGFGWVAAGLAALLLLVLLLDRFALPAADAPSGLPPTNGLYWAAMLIAGTLGTALGDALSGDLGMGVGLASAMLGVVLATMFCLRAQPAFVTKGSYWFTIVIIRTTGTTVGDLLAHSLGLEPSTALSGILLAGTLLLWRDRPDAVLRRV